MLTFPLPTKSKFFLQIVACVLLVTFCWQWRKCRSSHSRCHLPTSAPDPVVLTFLGTSLIYPIMLASYTPLYQLIPICIGTCWYLTSLQKLPSIPHRLVPFSHSYSKVNNYGIFTSSPPSHSWLMSNHRVLVFLLPYWLLL